MNVKDSEKCISPWLGLLIITSICIIMSAAIFWEFRGQKNKPRGNKIRNKQVGEFTPVAFTPENQSTIQITDDKIIF